MKKLLDLLLQMESDVEKYNELETKETKETKKDIEIEIEKKVLVMKIMIDHVEINEMMKELLDKEMEKIMKNGEA